MRQDFVMLASTDGVALEGLVLLLTERCMAWKASAVLNIRLTHCIKPD
jgi:hypothetical protein